jgi:cyclopropane-fatty-acyl-phospholipid synthase
VAQASAAIAAIQAEIQRREALREAPPSTDDDANDAAKEEAVSLRHRAAPFLDMLRQSSAEGKDVVWGV